MEDVADECGLLFLRALDRHLTSRAVVEVQRVAVVDAHLEVDRPPVGVHERGVEPVGDFVGVTDRRRKRDDLHAGLSFRSFARVTSSVGPRFRSSMRWTSSLTTQVRSESQSAPFRTSESTFSLVATMMSFVESQSLVLS